MIVIQNTTETVALIAKTIKGLSVECVSIVDMITYLEHLSGLNSGTVNHRKQSMKFIFGEHELPNLHGVPTSFSNLTDLEYKKYVKKHFW